MDILPPALFRELQNVEYLYVVGDAAQPSGRERPIAHGGIYAHPTCAGAAASSDLQSCSLDQLAPGQFTNLKKLEQLYVSARHGGGEVRRTHHHHRARDVS